MYGYLMILFIITGIIAGYLTNLYAVRWLFRPIKRGGILPKWDISIASTDKKKQNLINSLADCVTNSILTSDVLKKGIPDHLIEKHLYKMIDKILEDPSNPINSILWGELSGFQETKEMGNRYIEQLMENKIVPFFCSVLKEEDFSVWLTEQQAHFIAEHLYEMLEKEAKKNETYVQILKDLYRENKTLTVEEIIGTEQWNSFVQKLISVFLKEKLIQILEKREQLEAFWDEIQAEFEIKKQINEFQQKIGQKKIGELIQLYELDQVVSHFWKESGRYWKTVEGRRVLRHRKKELMDFLLSMDEPFGEMLSDETWENIEQWIRDSIQELIPFIAEFIEKNEEELNEVIERSIRIAAEKNGKSEYLIWLEETIKLFIVSQIKISERLQKILETIKEKDSDAVAEQILDFLKTQKISDWVQTLSDKKKRQLWKELWKDHRWMEKFKQSVYEYLKGKPLSWVLDRFSIVFSVLICEKGKKLLLDSIEKNPEKVADFLLKWLESVCLEIGQISISDIPEEKLEKMGDFLFHKANHWIPEERETIVSYIEQWILEDGKKFLKTYPQQNAQDLGEKLQQRVIEQWHHFGMELENRSVGQCLSILNKKELKDTAVTTAVKKLREGMEQVLQEQIHKLVVDALNQLKPEELCTQVERLMGGQLKYLSYFGGFLGFLIAVGIGYWAVPGLSLYGSPTTWTGGILSVVSMGFIGVVTNIVAINMLFHPRKPIRWLAKTKYLHLFSKGVILQNQEKFAKAMAAYVSEELVSETAVRQLYEAKKPDFPKQVKQWIDNDGIELLKQNRTYIAEELIKWVLQYSKDGMQWLRQWLETKPMQTFISPSQLNEWAKKVDVQQLSWRQYDHWKTSNEKRLLSEWILEEDLKQQLFNFLQMKERESIQSFRQTSLEEIASQREDWYQEIIAKQWTLEQKRKFHSMLTKRWERIDTTKQKEKILTWLIQKCTILREDDTQIGEFQIVTHSVREWGDRLLDQKMEVGINWFYEHVVKKKIEQTFGYEQSEPLEGDDWWETIRKNLAAFGMQNIVEPIFRDAIWELKEVQLPLYLQSKRQEFSDMMRLFLEENVYSITVGDAVLFTLGEEYPATLNRILFGTIWKKPLQISEMLEKLAHMAVSLLLDQAPIVYLRMIGMDSLITLERKFHRVLTEAGSQILAIEEQKFVIAREMTNQISPVIMHLSVAELTGLVTNEMAHNIIATLVSENNIQWIASNITKSICQNYYVGQMISLEELEWSVRKQWESYEEKTIVIDQAKAAIAEQIQNLTEYGWKQIPDSLRMECSGIVVETAADIFQSQLQEIMKDLNLYGMTEERLLALTPKEMEETIRAFANPIFKMLYGLGFLGAVGGLNCYIAIILYVVEKIDGKRSDDKKDPVI